MKPPRKTRGGGRVALGRRNSDDAGSVRGKAGDAVSAVPPQKVLGILLADVVSADVFAVPAATMPPVPVA